MEIQSLVDGWRLIAESVERNQSVRNDDTFDINIPFEVHNSLVKEGKLLDINKENNLEKDSWVNRSKWKVENTFHLSQSEELHTFLYLTRIKAKATIFINDEEVGITDNAYKLNYFDISQYTKDGENTIEISLESLNKNKELTSIGIFDEIKIIQTRKFLVRDFSIIPIKKASSWDINAKLEIEAFLDHDIEMSLDIIGIKKSFTLKLKEGIGQYSATLSIPDDKVELWWPNGYGKPHIYPITIEIGNFSKEIYVAFRTIELKRNPNLSIIINGKPIFMKGANWKGSTLFSDGTFGTKERRLLESTAGANMNMLRLDKSTGYECQEFYSECDRLGITIWQTMPDVIEEEEYTLLGVKSHPSIVLWAFEGKGAERLSRRERELDPSRPVYIEEKENMCWPRWQDGETFEAYHKKSPDFVTEFGLPSYPGVEVIKQIAGDNGVNLTSTNMEKHQRFNRDIETIISLIARNCDFPLDMTKIGYLSQVMQAWALNSAIMGWRALMPYTMGTLYSSLNDTWPEISDSSIDYSGRWKVAHYAARRFFAPLCPLIFIENDKLMVYVTNDTAKDQEVELKLKLRYFNGKKKESTVYNVSIPSMSSVKVREVDLKKIDRDNLFAYAKMQTKNIIRERTALLTTPKNAHLENPGIKAEVTKLGQRKALITLSSSKPAFWVTLDSGLIDGVFSDNFIALRQTTTKTIVFDSVEELDIERLKENLSVMDLYSAMH